MLNTLFNFLMQTNDFVYSRKKAKPGNKLNSRDPIWVTQGFIITTAHTICSLVLLAYVRHSLRLISKAYLKIRCNTRLSYVLTKLSTTFWKAEILRSNLKK